MLACISLLACAAWQAPVRHLTASKHPMQYDIALPEGWKPGKKYPIVLVIESANRRFRRTLDLFAKARGDKPFILVAPYVLTNGGAAARFREAYPYDEKVWQSAASTSDWQFDRAGVAAVLKDVRREYGGANRCYLTGWEAGAHTLWALLFDEPSNYRMAIAVAPNYAGRWLPDRTPTYSVMPPVRCFVGARNTVWPRFSSQWDRAAAECRKRGFIDVTLTTVPNEDHNPLATAVMEAFYRDWSERH